jgi:hypothetical protein
VAEIKSTMDIIMEKTKGLTMSEEEKAEYRQQELSGRVRGLIQKFLDGILDLDKLKAEVAGIPDKLDDVLPAVTREAVSRIALGQNNEPIFQAIEETAGADAGPLREIEKEFMERLELERAACEKALKEGLEKKGISGSAVIPNPNADPEWRQHISDETEAFRVKCFSHMKR